ncbi:hypothetical protein [Burkholderia sp. Bp9015]|uniref:hypothetical protein n=1 Tax=Burkholderia sp. Bp9015 TaxID=2184563 RepID=UPI000F595B91|nr:hypothetical protein [Burkholderia sp. Bp9015]RQR60696.1 hypothetical protein DIE12_36740 [Burkholderia sp. Bp9015]
MWVPTVRRSIEEEFASVKLADRYHIQMALNQPDATWSHRRTLAFFFAWLAAIATAGALLWILAPYFAIVFGRLFPSLATLADLHEAAGCTAAIREWYFVKRVVVGYAAVLALLVIGLFMCLGARWLLKKRKRRVEE